MQSISSTTELWLTHPTVQVSSPSPLLRLFCFPYAGGGASLYRAWAELLPYNIDLRIVQLPGRENRLAEPPLTSVSTVVAEVASIMRPLLDRPFAFFGHSMGALLAFEVARALREREDLEPIQLFVSAFRAPQLPVQERPLMHNLDDAAFIDQLRRLNGTPPEVLQNSELLCLVLPTLRADMQICETYRYLAGAPLSCPISTFGGIQDHEVSRADLEGWREQTTASFVMRTLPGDHFFITSARPLLLQALTLDLTRLCQNLLTRPEPVNDRR